MTRHLLTASSTVALLLLTACGADPEVDPTPVATAQAAGTSGTSSPTDGSAAGACLEGATDCADVPTGTGGPESGPDGSLPVAEALAAVVEGPFLMSGFYLADGSGARLCEALAESFPPQCGGVSIQLDESGTPVDATTTTEGDVTWSDQPVTVEGEVVGDVFVVGAP